MAKSITDRPLLKPGPRNPSKYRPELCESLISFFEIEPIVYIKEVTTYKDGTTNEKEVPRASSTPYLIHWCRQNNICPDTIAEWRSRYPEFCRALIIAKQLQEAFIAECGLKEAHNAFMSFQALKNVSGWRDNREIEVTGDLSVEMNEIMKKYGAENVRDFKERLRQALNN